MNLTIVRLDNDETFPMPSVSRDGDAGIDLVAANGGTVNPGDSMVVGCGFSVDIPAGYVGLVCPRSGLAAKYHISVGNAPGVIDSSYRGEVKVILEHRGHKYTGSFAWKRGDRIAQLVIVPYMVVNEITEAPTLSDTSRGADGFGSTGVATASRTLAEQARVEAITSKLTDFIADSPTKAKGKKATK